MMIRIFRNPVIRPLRGEFAALLIVFASCRPSSAPTATPQAEMSSYDYSLPSQAAPPSPVAPLAEVPPPSTPARDAPGFAHRNSTATATCDFADGYRTVRFSDGSEYSGEFKDCRPLPGPARFKKGAIQLIGHATRGPGGMILKTATHQVTIGLD